MTASSVATVSALYIYPVKSCAGTEVSGIRLDQRGPLFDRRFMIVDSSGDMITQRDVPSLCQVTPGLLPTALSLNAPGMVDLKIPLNGTAGARIPANVWKHQTEAIDQGADAAGWLSEFIGQSVRLVRWADDMPRRVNRARTERDVHVAFADGYPVVLLSEASVADLNKRLKTPVPMNRFRPNIVLSGCSAYAEDTFKQIQIGDLGFDVVKPCERCVITTVDQVSAEKGREPLRTLASFRQGHDGKVVFGQNCVHHGFGAVRVGDAVIPIAP